MKIAFIVYNGMTILDFIGFYDPITRLKTMGFDSSIKWDICSYSTDIKDNNGLKIVPDKIREPLSDYDIIFIPGGLESRKLINDAGFMKWIKNANKCKYKVSVCTGSLILGRAGFLKNRCATTHPSAFDELKNYCKVSEDRIVDEGDVITAGGVTSSIDLGLYLCEKFYGVEIREKIQKQIDYPYFKRG